MTAARLFAVNARGRLLAEVAVAGRAGGGLGGRGRGARPGRARRRCTRPTSETTTRPARTWSSTGWRSRALTGAGGGITAAARPLALRYPDGAHDAEALLVSPSSGALFIVTKDFSGRARVYLSARPSATGIRTLRRVAQIELGGGEAVTAGDISADGRTIALRSYFRAYAWKRRRGESIAAALRAQAVRGRADLFDEGQGEALALTRHGGAFYTVPEGGQPPIRRYSPR